MKTPCTNICRYEDIDGEPRCISCFRTYDDLSQWIYMDEETRKQRIKQLKKDRREHERKQANSKNMEEKL